MIKYVLLILVIILCGCASRIQHPETVYPVSPIKDADMLYSIDDSAFIVESRHNKSDADANLTNIYWIISSGIFSIFVLSHLYNRNII